MVLVQKCPFFHLFFLGNIAEGNVFYDIVERKNALLGYKNKTFNKSKTWHFCILGNIVQENVFYDILQRKKAFLGYKNKKFKKSKNRHFSKGVNPWFWSEMAIFPTVFFRKYTPGKCLVRYSRTKKRLSRL